MSMKAVYGLALTSVFSVMLASQPAGAQTRTCEGFFQMSGLVERVNDNVRELDIIRSSGIAAPELKPLERVIAKFLAKGRPSELSIQHEDLSYAVLAATEKVRITYREKLPGAASDSASERIFTQDFDASELFFDGGYYLAKHTSSDSLPIRLAPGTREVRGFFKTRQIEAVGISLLNFKPPVYKRERYEAQGLVLDPLRITPGQQLVFSDLSSRGMRMGGTVMSTTIENGQVAHVIMTDTRELRRVRVTDMVKVNDAVVMGDEGARDDVARATYKRLGVDIDMNIKSREYPHHGREFRFGRSGPKTEDVNLLKGAAKAAHRSSFSGLVMKLKNVPGYSTSGPVAVFVNGVENVRQLNFLKNEMFVPTLGITIPYELISNWSSVTLLDGPAVGNMDY